MLNNINDLLLVAGQQEGGYEPYGETLQCVNLNGSQYFDTEVTPNPNLKIDVTFRTTGSDLSQNRCVFGGRISATGSDRKATAFWNIVSASGGYMRADYGNLSTGTSDIGTSSSTIDTWTNIVMDKGKVYLNGTLKYTFSNPFVVGTNPCSIIIGGMRSGTSSSSSTANFFIGDIQQAKIWDNDVLIRDYVPKLDIQLRPCLYDKVSKTFLYAKSSSGGTTTYDLGFKRWNKFDVDYIVNDANSYIKTGVNDEEETLSFETDFIYFSGSGYQYVLGAYAGDSYKNTVLYINTSGSIGAWVNKGYSQSAMLTNIVEENARISCYADTTKSIINETTSTAFVEGVERAGAEIYVFRRNGYNATPAQTTSNAIIGLHSLKFYLGGNLIRDYKPVVWHNSDTTAVACLYDEVYNKMYTNAGTGSFKAYITNISTTKTNVFTTTGATSGKAINAEGQIINSSASSYSALLPIVGGTVIECVSGDTGNNNYRFHTYDSSGNWIEQSLLLFAEGTGTVEPATGSFTAPLNAKYVRVSYATSASSTIQVKSVTETIYEVGRSVSGTPSSSALGVSNCFDTGLYGTQDTTVKHIAIAYDSDGTSGQLFGSYDGTQTTSKNLTINSTGTSGNTAPIRFDGKVISTPLRIGINKTVSIINSKYGLWVNDNLHGSWGSVNDFTTLTTMLILKCNNSTNTRNNGCGYCLILEKDVPVAEYIPVKNGSTIGLYDKVSKTLNTGVGTINFNALN